MAKAPALGCVKSRLARDVGDARALAVYHQLLAVTAAAAARWTGPVLLASAGDEAHFADSAVEGLPREPQPDGELGVRIAAALRAGLARAEATIVIGSDCPGLSQDALAAVVAALDEAPVAFGPAADGGFWSIATTTEATANAVQRSQVAWSCADTLAELRAELHAEGLPSRVGPLLADCDTGADLQRAIADGLLPPLPCKPRSLPRVPPDLRAPTPLPATARVVVVIPAIDEERALPSVLAEIPRDLVAEVVVVDNGSTDRTVAVAEAGGARVVHEPRRGYGAACLAGIAATADADVLVFLDGDHSDFPEDLHDLLPPVLRGEADLVIGSRMLQATSRRALLPQARFGNRLATVLMRLCFGIRCTDLGPFRVVRRSSLLALDMQDRDFGWTVEMQVRARLAGLRVLELPVRYRARIGQSKISGTLQGTIRAGHKILGTIFRYRLRPPRLRAEDRSPTG